jgi:autotransporter-associated beta strand protein
MPPERQLFGAIHIPARRRPSLRLASFILTFLMALGAEAARITWDGGDTGDSFWNSGNNWNPNGDIASGSDLFFDGGDRLTNLVANASGINKDPNSIVLAGTVEGSILVGRLDFTNGAGGMTNLSKNHTMNFTNDYIALGANQGWFATSNSMRFGSVTEIKTDGFNLRLGGPSNITISGVIEGTGNIFHTGNGKAILEGANTFTGFLSNSLGTLQINSIGGLGTGGKTVFVTGGTLLFTGGATNTSAAIRMGGGTLEVEDTEVSVGTLTMAANSTLNLENAGSTGRIRFNSATNLTGTAVLTISGWTGTEAGGTGDLIFFSNTSQITSSFLSNVQFVGGILGGAQILGSGELVPITPEPSTLLGGGSVLLLFLKRLRKRSKVSVNT